MGGNPAASEQAVTLPLNELDSFSPSCIPPPCPWQPLQTPLLPNPSALFLFTWVMLLQLHHCPDHTGLKSSGISTDCSVRRGTMVISLCVHRTQYRAQYRQWDYLLCARHGSQGLTCIPAFNLQNCNEVSCGILLII